MIRKHAIKTAFDFEEKNLEGNLVQREQSLEKEDKCFHKQYERVNGLFMALKTLLLDSMRLA